MTEQLFTTGGPLRLPVFFLSAAAFAVAMGSCSGEQGAQTSKAGARSSAAASAEPATSFGEGSGITGDLLWDTPELPAGLALEISGIPVEFNILEGYLLPKWSTFSGALPLDTPTEELATEFFAQPEVVYYQLVRGVLLLREAEARFPELDSQGLARFKERMEGAAGTTKDSLIKRYGVEGWAAHVERRYRLTLLEREYQELAPEVTEEELYEFYDSEILANLPEPEKREQVDISFKSLEPMLRANLMKGRAIDAQEEWLDGVIIGVEVKATLPAGVSHSWVIAELP